ncbi:MAG: hypothetical protein ACLR6W_04865 [Evtepia sp.]
MILSTGSGVICIKPSPCCNGVVVAINRKRLPRNVVRTRACTILLCVHSKALQQGNSIAVLGFFDSFLKGFIGLCTNHGDLALGVGSRFSITTDSSVYQNNVLIVRHGADRTIKDSHRTLFTIDTGIANGTINLRVIADNHFALGGVGHVAGDAATTDANVAFLGLVDDVTGNGAASDIQGCVSSILGRAGFSINRGNFDNISCYFGIYDDGRSGVRILKRLGYLFSSCRVNKLLFSGIGHVFVRDHDSWIHCIGVSRSFSDISDHCIIRHVYRNITNIAVASLAYDNGSFGTAAGSGNKILVIGGNCTGNGSACNIQFSSANTNGLGRSNSASCDIGYTNCRQVHPCACIIQIYYRTASHIDRKACISTTTGICCNALAVGSNFPASNVDCYLVIIYF